MQVVHLNQIDQARRSEVDISSLIDQSPVSPFQFWLMVLIGIAVVMDGFDVQAMGYVAPAIIKDWGIKKAELGPVFGAGLFGMLIGSISLSMISDRIGRRPVLIGSTLFFSVCMLSTAYCRNLDELLIARFITGIGLGAIMSNAIALVSEYSPHRKRVSLMMWVSCGFTAGAVIGGLTSAALLNLGGWRAVFIVGGIIPFIVSLIMWKYLPESLQFLVMKNRNTDKVRSILKRIAPSAAIYDDTKFLIKDSDSKSASIAALFRTGLGLTTLLLWGVNFMNLLNLFFLANWLPTLVIDLGYSQQTAVLAGTILQTGGVIGTLLFGPLIDKFGFYRVLIPSFIVAMISVACVGQPGLSLAALFPIIVFCGFCIVGGQPAINALAATIYPTSLRATGVGWSLGIGRIGSIVGPILAGHFIALQWSTEQLFFAAAVPAGLSCLMIVAMSFLQHRSHSIS